jgi:hypothetical protein
MIVATNLTAGDVVIDVMLLAAIVVLAAILIRR